MAALRVLCPQEYDGMEMRVTPCDRCAVGWDHKEGRCSVFTGAEHLPLVQAHEVPACPMQGRCQHQIQQGDFPCAIRARGLICESALRTFGKVKNPENHPLGFHAGTVASPEDLEEQSESTSVGMHR